MHGGGGGGDIVLVQDINALRGRWKMAVGKKAIISSDGKVRRVEIMYNNNGKVTVERPVQKLIILVPVDG